MKKLLLSVLVLAFLLTSCALPAVSPTPTAEPEAPLDAGIVKGVYPGKTWQTADTPEQLGWSSEKLAKAREYSDKIGSAAVMIVDDGIVVDAWGDITRKYQCHSMRKSLLSALIGIHVEEGNIDMSKTMAELGIDDNEPSLTPEEKQATVADLIKARSGIYHVAVGESAGMKAIRPERHSHAPGTFWYYNNWDFNALGTIFEQETGTKIYEEFDQRIAQPLQMEDFSVADTWYGTGAESIHPYYGCRMSARDLARFGLLFLREGRWPGGQDGVLPIVPADWVRESTASHSKTGPDSGYGYMWWTGVNGGLFPNVPVKEHSYYASGYGGHKIIVLPYRDLVVVHRVDTDRRGQSVGLSQIGTLLWLILDAAGETEIGEAPFVEAANGVRLRCFPAQWPAGTELADLPLRLLAMAWHGELVAWPAGGHLHLGDGRRTDRRCTEPRRPWTGVLTEGHAMNEDLSSVRVAVVQAAPVLFDREATVDKTCRLICEAAAQDAQLILFPEAFVPAYPRGLSLGMVVGSRSPEGRRIWQRYWENAVIVPSAATEKLGDVVRELGVYLAIGIIERNSQFSGGTLYCTLLYYGPDGRVIGKHRKLKPTGAERLIWGEGDGSTLTVLDTEVGRIGGLICWENYMPLARMALYGQGVEIYLAPTAGARETWQATLRHIACEGRCFVLGCNQYVRRDMYPADLQETNELRGQPEVMCRGGSAIVSPLGEVIAGPLYDQEGILYAELDRGEIVRGKVDFDVVGHYARPDVFQLIVDEGENAPISCRRDCWLPYNAEARGIRA